MTSAAAVPGPGGRARVVLATHSQHKVAELRSILAGALAGALSSGVEVVAAGDLGVGDVVESGVTFAENALLKARHAATVTGLPALADDSGIAVDVLGGSPGIFSARWAGRHGDDAANLALLLAQLADIPDAHRRVAYVCAAALVLPDGTEHVETGRMPGTLVRAPRGTNGFGYDPIVVPDAQTPGADGRLLTCAEMDPAVKEAISHRGTAFRAMAPVVAEALRRLTGQQAAT